ncbi:hypothetical protein AVEN_17164-1 [Araneus ventricosus]|uniref:Uncharacterized protein n=1 Tax=Araneus ventricosus TaxID=182803 RepID=A0A4Y2VYG8_ARAVE|nr:hypothetical protein AVEN_3095-1 [Araneus ventricosus]GBO29691.1 hypothetical protein AVEN_17164-1 [Araneus ventricosus]
MDPQPRNLAQLATALESAWLNIPVNTFRNLIDSLPVCLVAVRSAKASCEVDSECPWNILWTDVVHLDSSVNIHNCQIWDSQNTCSILDVLLDSPQMMLQYRYSALFILGLYSLEEKNFADILKRHFIDISQHFHHVRPPRIPNVRPLNFWLKDNDLKPMLTVSSTVESCDSRW